VLDELTPDNGLTYINVNLNESTEAVPWYGMSSSNRLGIRTYTSFKHRQCCACGRRFYSAGHPRYVVLPDGPTRPIYQGLGGELLVREEVYLSLTPFARKFRLRFKELKIEREPKDGLGWF
jgi:hypothetical protein